MKDRQRWWPGPNVWLGLVAASLWACPEGQGKILGDIDLGAQALEPQCFIPCTTVADCPPDQGNGYDPYVWKCDYGRCIPVACLEDADCVGQFACDIAGEPCTCIDNQCLYPCYASGFAPSECIDDRDFCRPDDLCERLPEVPPEPCVTAADCGPGGLQPCPGGGSCFCDRDGLCLPDGAPRCPATGECLRFLTLGDEPVCFSQEECLPWESCRRDFATFEGQSVFHCLPFTVDSDPAGYGKPCDPATERSCDARQLSQTIQNLATVGTNVPTNAYWGLGSLNCDDFCTVGQLGGCDPETACTATPGGGDHAPAGGRTLCLPEDCLAGAGCTSSLTSCAHDSDCPTGESCTYPLTHCAGVCMELGCASCAAWLDANGLHACFEPDLSVDIQVIRPD